MVASGAILVACKEYPHVDYPQRAEELYTLLERGAREGLRTRTVMRRVPMLGIMGTTEEPMRGFVRKMQAREREPGILSISAMHGFPVVGHAVHLGGDARGARGGRPTRRDGGPHRARARVGLLRPEDHGSARRLPIDEALDARARERALAAAT
jgi:hypothetical protein